MNNISTIIPSETAFMSLLINTITRAKAINAGEGTAVNEEQDSVASSVMALPLTLLCEIGADDCPSLKTITFPDGINAGDMRISKFRACIQAYANKDYIPIVNFPADKENDDLKNDILTVVEEG